MGYVSYPQADRYDRWEIACQTAEEMLRALSPLAEHWWRPNATHPAEWIFRGQADSTWGLTPTRFRGADGSNTAKLRAAELSDVREFLDRVDQQGMSIPHDTPAYRDPEWRTRAVTPFQEMWKTPAAAEIWPPLPLLPNMALAQHYGIATSMLDWSRCPLTSAYFAARTAIDHEERQIQASDGRLAVYGLRINAVRCLAVDTVPQVVIATAPYATNDNLRAQRALFTVVRTRYDTNPPDLDVAMQAAASRSGDAFNIESAWSLPDLCRFTLPCTQARRLLRLLAIHNIDASSVFPGCQGIVQAMAEVKLWR